MRCIYTSILRGLRSVVPLRHRRRDAPHVLHQRGGPPCLHPEGTTLHTPSNSVTVQHVAQHMPSELKRTSFNVHTCSVRRRRPRTAGRRNPRTPPASRPMTSSPSSGSSARSASASCLCSARRWLCKLPHVRRRAACPTGVHCDLPNTLSSSPCACTRTGVCDISLLCNRCRQEHGSLSPNDYSYVIR